MPCSDLSNSILRRSLRHRLLHGWINLSRLVLAAVFVFSGFVKACDPLGMSYKVEAYFAEFGLQSPVVGSIHASVVLAVCLGAFEFLLGVFLLGGIHRRFTSWCTLVFMGFMTGLTAYLYFFSSIPDCGCFGEAVTLSNKATFGKNVCLLVLAVSLLYAPRRMTRFITERNQWIIVLYSLLYILVLSSYTLYSIPPLDFTPYKVGTDLRAATEGEYETWLVYENESGRRDTFGIDRLPDSPEWTYVSRFTNTSREPAITDLAMYDAQGDVTDLVLADTGYVYLLTFPNLATADTGCSDYANDLYDYCTDRGYAFYGLTVPDSDALNRWIDQTGATYPFYGTDTEVLKSMVRSNPGLMLLRDGKIIGKWGHNDFSAPARVCELDCAPDDPGGGSLPSDSMSAKVLAVILWFAIPLLLVIGADRIWISSKFYKHHIFKRKLKTTKKMRKKIVAGNWKMNKTLQEGIELAKELNTMLAADQPNCDVVICTPFIHLASVSPLLDSGLIGLGAENCADKASGAYTGEVSAEMVKSTGAQYVILGHSERRAYYNETPEILKEKIGLALANGLKVIFCIGEVLEEREAGKQNEVVKAQLEGSLFDLTAEQFSQIILAYEPVWAIGTGKTATSDQAEEMHAYIRGVIAEKFGADAAENVSILYGGSCKASNAKELFSKPDVDGGLIGGASLKAADFKGIIDAWK